MASRGATPKELMDKMWFNGSDFLWESKAPFAPCQIDNQPCLENDDPEVRVHVFNIIVEPTQKPSILDRLNYFSGWTRALRAIAHCQKCKEKLIQKEAFSQELEDLSRSTRKTVNGSNRNDRHLRYTSSLYRLDLFLDEHYLFRVGGRLNKGSFCKDLANGQNTTRTTIYLQWCWFFVDHFISRRVEGNWKNMVFFLLVCRPERSIWKQLPHLTQVPS